MPDQPAESGEPDPAGHGPSAPGLLDLVAVGIAVSVCVVAAGAIGYWLDSVFKTTPWLTFAGLAFGITSAVLYTVAKVRRYL